MYELFESTDQYIDFFKENKFELICTECKGRIFELALDEFGGGFPGLATKVVNLICKKCACIKTFHRDSLHRLIAESRPAEEKQ